MSIQITNLSNRPIVLTLSSGNTLHLAPNATSPELQDVEVKNNDKIDKLRGQFVISIDESPLPQTGTQTDTPAEIATTTAAELVTTSADAPRSGRKGRSRGEAPSSDNP
jgi:hypothetical protein